MFKDKFKESFKLLPLKLRLGFFNIVFYSILISIFEFFSIASLPILLGSLLNFNENSNFEYFEIIKLNSYLFELFNFERIIIFIGIIFFLKFLLSIIFFYQESIYRKRVCDYFRTELFKNFMKLNYLDQINYKKGDLLKRILSDPSSLSSLLISYINILKDFLIVSIIILFMFIFNYEITLISALIIIFLSVIFTFLFKTKIKIWGDEDQKLRSELNITTDNSFSSSKEIKVMGFQQKFIKLFSNLVQNQSTLDFKNRFVIRLPRVIFEILIILFVLFFLFFSKDIQLNINSYLIQISVYLYAFARILPSANAVVSNITSTYYFIPSVDFIQEGLKIASNKENNNKDNNIKNDFNNFNSIFFRNVSVNYKDKNLIRDVNFSIHRNKINIIKGPSGVGKSTCLNILTGLIKQSHGEISFDGKSTILYENNLWQKNLGYLTQSNYLFNTSIMENITFQNDFEKIDQEKFNFSLELSNLNKVFDLKKIKNFIVGINGNKVSGGQAQKILFARSLYFGKNILILDEPTSGLDDVSKEEMISSFKILVRNHDYTVILSTHENFKNLDCNIIELNNKINQI